VRVSLDDDLRRSRMTVAFRALLAVPHIVWLTLWGIVAFLAAIASWFATLAVGRPPAALHRFLSAYLRYQAHVGAFLWLAANPFPGFTGAPGRYPLDVEIDPPATQHRAITLFRIVLAVPALLVASALGTAQLAAGVGGWAASLATGRMPRGLRDLSAFCIRYSAQVNAYLLIVTDRYPYSGPTLETGPVSVEWAPPVAPTPDFLRRPEAL
jgi:hypothetical protein